jgi:hypothetical protein
MKFIMAGVRLAIIVEIVDRKDKTKNKMNSPNPGQHTFRLLVTK